jgi:hypothetical protein
MYYIEGVYIGGTYIIIPMVTLGGRRVCLDHKDHGHLGLDRVWITPHLPTLAQRVLAHLLDMRDRYGILLAWHIKSFYATIRLEF